MLLREGCKRLLVLFSFHSYFNYLWFNFIFMNEDIKEQISHSLSYLGIQCECRNKYFFTIADDNHIVCDNCKRRHRIILREIK